MAGRVAQQVLALLGTSPFSFFGPTPYCLPSLSKKCFSESDLVQLNTSLSGRVIVPAIPDWTNCVEADCFSQYARISPGNVQYTNFESGRGLGGLANGSDIVDERGRIPNYSVEVAQWSDVTHAVNFARDHRLRLRIKSTGHDYLGRSSDQASFTIRTSALNSSRFEPSFIAAGAPEGTAGVNALVVGSGSSVMDLYRAADENKVLVVGGTTRTVGAGGGWAVGGGHGPLAPLLGLAVDNILEMTVVIANGSIIKASPFSHPRLFKSLCGGGGAFGVNLEVVFKTHTPPAGFIGAFGEFSVIEGAKDKAAAWKELNRQWIKAQLPLAAAGFAGYSYMRTIKPSPFAYIIPSNDLPHARAAWKTFMDFVEEHAELKMEMKWVEEKTYFKLWEGEFTDALQSLDEVGINLLLGGRLVPRTLVESGSHDVADFVSSLPSPSIVHLVAGGAVAAASGEFTSINPLWRETLLHIDLPVSWPSTASHAAIQGLRKYVTTKTRALGKICTFPSGEEGCYPSEADYDEEEWQRVWYGTAYPELLATKKLYDHKGVFTSRKAVGSEVVGW